MTGRVFTLTETRDNHPKLLSVHLEGHELARFTQPTHTNTGWQIAVPDGRMYLLVPVGGFDEEPAS